MSAAPRVGMRPAVWTASGVDPFEIQLGLAEEAERMGFDAVFFGERILSHVGSGGQGIYNSTHTELFVTLSAMAARTTRIQIGSLVLVVPYRHPVLLAKMIASVDQLSRGRLLLGIGAGWNQTEFDVLGLDRRQAASLMNEGLECMKLLWTGEPVVYNGVHYQLNDISVEPTPFRKGGPPIWLGSFAPNGRAIWEGGGITPGVDKVLNRVGRLADTWVPLVYSSRVKRCIEPELLGETARRVQEHAAAAGRERVEFAFSHWFYAIENAQDEAEARRDLGVFFPGSFEEAKETYLIGSPEEIVAKVHRLTRHVDKVDWVVFTTLGPNRRQLELLYERILPLIKGAD